MKVNFSSYSDSGNYFLKFGRVPSTDDLKYTIGRKAQLSAQEEILFVLEKDVASTGVHPDILGLVALLCFRPFIANNLELNSPVSIEFSKAVKNSMGIVVTPVSEKIKPRSVPVDPLEAVAFSGGNDSIAAMYLSDNSAVGFFLQRFNDREVGKSLYKDDAAIYACDQVASSGRKIVKVKTSLEFLRNPVGFPVDWSNGVPALLHADQFKLGSIAYGMVLESAYFLGHSHFSDLRNRAVYSYWAPLFQAVGAPISLPTAGLSEIVTSKISARLAPQWHGQSCVRGTVGNPCMNCFKCFRKRLLDFEILGTSIDESHFNMANTSKEVKRRILEIPIHHENVMSYSMLNLELNHPIATALRARANAFSKRVGGLSFLSKFYSPSSVLIPEHLRNAVVARILEITNSMTEFEVEQVISWNLKPVIDDSDYQEAVEIIGKILN